MALTVWSPKGGSGTSVVAAGLAVVLSRASTVRAARLADLAGDQSGIFGLATEPQPGLADWLAQGVEAPTDALDRIAVHIRPHLTLLPRGGTPGTVTRPLPGDDATGAALAVALDHAPTIVDAGVPRDPAARGLITASPASIVVVRPCYLALRRAVHDELLTSAAGVVLVDEPGRAIDAGAVGDVLGKRVLARIRLRTSIARAVDAGLFSGRLPRDLLAPLHRVLETVGLVHGLDEGAAA